MKEYIKYIILGTSIVISSLIMGNVIGDQIFTSNNQISKKIENIRFQLNSVDINSSGLNGIERSLESIEEKLDLHNFDLVMKERGETTLIVWLDNQKIIYKGYDFTITFNHISTLFKIEFENYKEKFETHYINSPQRWEFMR